MSRLAAKTVFWAFVIAWRLAMWPTSRRPLSAIATIDGVVLYPPRLGMTLGTPPSTVATQLFVVPRSIPITRSMAPLPVGPSSAKTATETTANDDHPGPRRGTMAGKGRAGKAGRPAGSSRAGLLAQR